MKKFLIVTMGPGETSQGAALGKYVLNAGHKVTFGVLLEENLHFLEKIKCPKILLSNGNEVKKEVCSKKYDVAVFCNSKMYGVDKSFQNDPPPGRPFCVSLDSNWLFNQVGRFPFISWLNWIYLNFPKDVYKYGLVEKGGAYVIPEEVKKIISTVGLIPSYSPLAKKHREKVRNKLGLTKKQKLIFTYIGSGVTFHEDFINRYIKIIDVLHKKHSEIKVLYLSGEEPKKSWIIPVGGRVDSQTFYEYLASSDLVFQHQGLGTLEQAISANVPVISNVSPIRPGEKVHAHAWEIKPFERAGLCKMHYYNDLADEIDKSVEGLLYLKQREEMIEAQKTHRSIGEKNMLNEILGRLK
jgi:hypothetical protein